MNKQLKARSPAKLILSGEHSVVYGMPAIALAIDCFAESTIKSSSAPQFSPKIFFNFLNLEYARSFTVSTLHGLKQRILEQYHAFLEGNCTIREVLKMPFELLQFTVSNLLETAHIPLSHGVEIRTVSNIPIGCGMGSSAATVMSTLFALAHFFNIDIDTAKYLTLGKEAENLQHGRSSGLDLQLALRGGCLRFQDGNYSNRTLPRFPITIVHTGKPEATTGQCVSATAVHFENSHIAFDFKAVTNALEQALENNDIISLCHAIRENHKLLVNIGVVPQRIQDFIAAIEKEGGAAKICGAGSVQGESGGVVWVLGPEGISENILKHINQYGYTHQTVVGDTLGTRIV